VFEDVGMALFTWDARSCGYCLKHGEELRPVEPSAFLRHEQRVRAISWPCSQPRSDSGNFIKQRLAAMRAERLLA
jgi:hypothetical protein